jgi:hypothetical protein
MKSTPRSDAPEQLALLDVPGPATPVPTQFQLSDRTRQLGLAQVARIRRQLQEQAARQRAQALPTLPAPIRHQHADAA